MQIKLLAIFICSLFASAAGDIVDLKDDLKPYRKTYKLPAIGAAVIVDGRLTALGAAGVRKIGSEVQVTAGDKFHLGSCTKAMTATLAAMVVEQGKLNWNTTIQEIFADTITDIHDDYKKVTLAQLLAHRGGFPSPGNSFPEGTTFMQLHKLPGNPRAQRLEYLKIVLKQSPEKKPGQYLYSNAGFTVAGAMIEKVMDRIWEDMMRDMIFNPLGMKTAGFGSMGTPGDIIDQPWQHRTVGKHIKPIEPGPFSDNPAVIGPGGTVHCSLEDWAKFVQLHLAGFKRDTELLSHKTFKWLHSPGYGQDYCGGWRFTLRPWADGITLTHAGSNKMNYAVVWMAPKKNFAVLVVSNQGGGKVQQACDQVASRMIKKFLTD